MREIEFTKKLAICSLPDRTLAPSSIKRTPRLSRRPLTHWNFFARPGGGVSMDLMLDQSLQASVGTPNSSHSHRILVVDDNRDAAESLAVLLSLTGDETRVAYDGLEALETAAEFKPDAILLDIGLPKLNGYEVARKIRQAPGGDKVLLIALTGWSLDADRRRSIAAGFDEHFIKPMDYFALASTLAGVTGAG